MPRRIHFYDPPQRFVAGTVGPPGQRTFFLQARDASRITSVALEKVQVELLAEKIDQMLDDLVDDGATAAAIPTAEPRTSPTPTRWISRSSRSSGWATSGSAGTRSPSAS